MTLLEAIQHALEVGQGMCPCSEDHRQLAMWLLELQNHRQNNLKEARTAMAEKVKVLEGTIVVEGSLTEKDKDPVAQLLRELADVWDPHVNDILRKHGVVFQHEDGTLYQPGA